MSEYGYLPGLELKSIVVWAMNLLPVLLMPLLSLQLPCFLTDLSLRSITIIRNIAKTTTIEMMDTMIMMMEFKERVLLFWRFWDLEWKRWCLWWVWFFAVLSPGGIAGRGAVAVVLLSSMNKKSNVTNKKEKGREREREMGRVRFWEKECLGKGRLSFPS